MRDATLRSFSGIALQIGFLKDFRRGDMTAVLGNGAEIIFRSADDPDKTMRGPNLSGAWLDEASQMGREAYLLTIAALREGGQQGWLSATFTPRGLQHWTYDVFGRGGPNVAMFHSRTVDNPFNPPEFSDPIRAQYTTAFSQQELDGRFVNLAGAMFNRAWFRVVSEAPREVRRRVRYWDMAATAPKTGTDPDWTAGCAMSEQDGRYWITDMRHVRQSPLLNEQLVKSCADVDGKAVPIAIEQEPGSASIGLIDHYQRHVLQGFAVRADRVTREKQARAMPMAAAAEAGNVMIVAAAWNKAFLDEIEMFPDGGHDDQVDAASGAFGQLATPRSVNMAFAE